MYCVNSCELGWYITGIVSKCKKEYSCYVGFFFQDIMLVSVHWFGPVARGPFVQRTRWAISGDEAIIHCSGRLKSNISYISHGRGFMFIPTEGEDVSRHSPSENRKNECRGIHRDEWGSRFSIAQLGNVLVVI